MDNLTHSLVGATVAEVYFENKFQRSTFRPPKGIFYFFSIFANNCPDLDLLFGLIDNTQLGYLLNHRGWTHTVVGTLPQIVLLGLLAWIWISFFRRDLSGYLKDLIFLIFIGTQTHMLLDYFNSYGVHPWAPFNNEWYYLDSIFIIEPLLWISLTSIWFPPWNWARLLLLIPTVAAYGFGWWTSMVPIFILLIVGVFATLVFNIQSYLLKTYRGLVGLFLFSCVVLLFWCGQYWARNHILDELGKEASQKTLDIVLYSLPSNANCWFFLSPQVSGEQYTVTHGSFALFGNSQNCRSWSQNTDVATAPGESEKMGDLWIRKRWTASLRDLRPMLDRCDVRAWFQFVRVPYWEGTVLNDMRFAARSGKNLTTHDLNDWLEPVCPVLSVPWQPPRQDLIDLVEAIPVD